MTTPPPVKYSSMRHVRHATPTLPEEREGEDFDAYLGRITAKTDPYGLCLSSPADAFPSPSREGPCLVRTTSRWSWRRMSTPI